MKIICKLANASENINGIPFVQDKDGSMVASGVSAEDAAGFDGIAGYEIEDDNAGETKAQTKARLAAEAAAVEAAAVEAAAVEAAAVEAAAVEAAKNAKKK